MIARPGRRAGPKFPPSPGHLPVRDSPEKATVPDTRAAYVALNVAAAAGHAGLAFWGFAVSLDKKRSFLTLDIFKETSAVFTFANDSTAEDAYAEAGGKCGAKFWRGDARGPTVVGLRRKCQFQWDPLLLLSATEVFTAFFHLVYVFECLALRERFWTRGFHGARWLEYSVSATVYTVSNFVGVGARNLYAVVFACALGALVQASGALAEWGYALIYTSGKDNHLVPALRNFANSALATGCVAQGLLFFAIYHQLFEGDSSGGFEKDGKSFQGFREVAAAYLAQYLFFPLIFFVHLARLARGKSVLRCDEENSKAKANVWLARSFAAAEYQYVLAGACAKVSLFVMIFTVLNELNDDYFEDAARSTARWRMIRSFGAYAPPAVWVTAAIMIEVLVTY